MGVKGKRGVANERRDVGRCVYCGLPLTPGQARRWPGTCNSHADLPACDPDYMLSLRAGHK